MGIAELFFIAVGLSMDAFAVAICHGVSMKKANCRKALAVGLYFGVFQAIMPLIGYLIGFRFAQTVKSYDHWIAFALLSLLGIRMIAGSFKKEGSPDKECQNKSESSLGPKTMLPLALATSIDALAIGVSFAFMQVQIVPAVLFIGIITLILSTVGVKIGSFFGNKFKSKAEMLGGVILVLMGLKILIEHLAG